jgi:hypothetical protein
MLATPSICRVDNLTGVTNARRPLMILNSSPNSARSHGIALTLTLLAILSVYYAFVATLGTFSTLSWNTDYYDQAAEGFRHGHLYLQTLPKPELLAKPNPFDYANVRLWLWDAVLFNDHYYIYWGPVPALCVLVFKWVTSYQGIVLDQWLTLFFMLGRLYGGAALILSVANFAGPRPPAWATALGIVVFAVASPTPFVMARPVIYEACVGAGQCFLFWGLTAAFWGLLLRAWQTPLFVLAGILWGMSLGSRVTFSLVAPLLVVISAVIVSRRDGYALRPLLRAGFTLGVPVVLSLAGYAVYNYLRFGSVTEFGVTYQLTGRAFASESAFVLPNLVSYAFAELAWSCRFPFASLPMHRHLSELITWPADYDVGNYELGERVAGVFVSATWCWLLALWVWRLIRGLWLRARRPAGSLHERLSHAALWTLLCSLATVCSLLPALRMWTGSMRYLEDAIGGLLIAAMLAGLWLLRRTDRSSNSVVAVLGRATYVVLAIHTIVVGLCLGFSGHTDNFRHSSPVIYQKLVDALSICRG